MLLRETYKKIINFIIIKYYALKFKATVDRNFFLGYSGQFAGGKNANQGLMNRVGETRQRSV